MRAMREWSAKAAWEMGSIKEKIAVSIKAEFKKLNKASSKVVKWPPLLLDPRAPIPDLTETKTVVKINSPD